MATLTAAQILAIRRRVGDVDCKVFEDDADIQTAYDAANSDLNLTYIDLLEQMRGVLRLKVDTTDETGDRKHLSQMLKNTVDLLNYYRSAAGASMGSLRAGQLVLDIDQPCPDNDPDCWERWP